MSEPTKRDMEMAREWLAWLDSHPQGYAHSAPQSLAKLLATAREEGEGKQCR